MTEKKGFIIMCTAATYQTKNFYFGRTLDYDFSYCDEVTITPRNYPFHFCNMGEIRNHYAMIGMAYVAKGYPLYYDAVNEKGLGMAGLNFIGNAYYSEKKEQKENIAQFEFIPWILARCASVKEARELLKKINLINVPFDRRLPPAQLHWLIADSKEAITVESVKEGMQIYDNPVGILTNNPPFQEQMLQLSTYMHLSPKSPKNSFSDKLKFQEYSRGMGALGLPGDYTSQSRFVRAAFTKMNSVSGDSELESVNQFFHILESVDVQRGCCELGEGKYQITIYTSCCNTNQGIYYYTTYENHQITAVNMYQEELNGSLLARYPLIQGEQIRFQNKTKEETYQI